jgi:hypothetical protein
VLKKRRELRFQPDVFAQPEKKHDKNRDTIGALAVTAPVFSYLKLIYKQQK